MMNIVKVEVSDMVHFWNSEQGEGVKFDGEVNSFGWNAFSDVQYIEFENMEELRNGLEDIIAKYGMDCFYDYTEVTESFEGEDGYVGYINFSSNDVVDPAGISIGSFEEQKRLENESQQLYKLNYVMCLYFFNKEGINTDEIQKLISSN